MAKAKGTTVTASDVAFELSMLGFTATAASAFIRDVEHLERQLEDEQYFMFHNFPVHFAVSDTQIEERFNELLEKWVYFTQVAQGLIAITRSTMAKL